MATAAEHFREAEACLSASEYQRQEGDIEGATLEVQHAQAHATLALAAALMYPTPAMVGSFQQRPVRR